MDNAFYDTSYTLYAVTDSTPQYRDLLKAQQSALDERASQLRDHLGTERPQYEDDEERERIGSLRDCTCSILRPQSEVQTYYSASALSLSLIYDRATYKFLFPVLKPIERKKRFNPFPLLLSKASAAHTKRFFSFLDLTFGVSPVPLKLPSSFLPRNLSTYVSTIYTSLLPLWTTQDLLPHVKDTINHLKLTVSVNTANPATNSIAKNLRTIDLDVPPETLLQLLSDSKFHSAHNEKDFLELLAYHLHQRTGLHLPLINTGATQVADALTFIPTPPSTTSDADAEEPPLKLTRISTSTLALSSEGRLKFSSKPVLAVETLFDEGGSSNIVRKANNELLSAILAEAAGVAEGKG